MSYTLSEYVTVKNSSNPASLNGLYRNLEEGRVYSGGKTEESHDRNESERSTISKDQIPSVVNGRRSSGYQVSTLSTSDLKYSVQEWVGSVWRGCCLRQKRTKVILDGLTIQAKSGQLTAILGNSGSGKTSLLDVIASWGTGKVEGKVYLDSGALTANKFRKVGAYVIQADRLLPYLTVEETLRYVAQLKFSGTHTKVEISEKIRWAMNAVGLTHVASSMVGGLIEKSLSGGEKRRLSVAVHLLQDPDVILLDEPTTGLDSFMARHLVETLSNLARSYNKVVLMTIHQPRSDIFQLIDTVGIMTAGKMVYYGPRKDMIEYFSARGFPCPTYANPLDYFIDVASIDRRSVVDENKCLERLVTLTTEYSNSSMYKIMFDEVQKQVSQQSTRSRTNSTEQPPKSRMKSVFRFSAVTRRMFANISRDRPGMLMRLFSMMAFSSFIWIFLQRLTNRLVGIQDRSGLFYQCTAVPASIGLLNAIGLFPTLRDLYYRERRDGLYGCIVFMLAYLAHVVIFHVVSSIIFAVWVYWGCGLYPDGVRFLIFYYVLVMMQIHGELQTTTTLAICNNPAIAQSVSMLINTAAILGATGLLKSTESLLPPLRWLSHLSIFKYATEVLVANEYEKLQFTCDPGTPCVVRRGMQYLAVTFPNAVKNMNRNLGLLPLFVLGMLLLSIIFFRLRGNRTLY